MLLSLVPLVLSSVLLVPSLRLGRAGSVGKVGQGREGGGEDDLVAELRGSPKLTGLGIGIWPRMIRRRWLAFIARPAA